MPNSNTHPHSFGLTPQFDRIPDALKHGHWCVWVASPREGKPGKFDKIPCNGSKWISTSAPSDWLSYEQAVQLYMASPSKFNGIGRLVEQDGLTFIDIDAVGDLSMYTDKLQTYWERSPSGTGIRGVSLGTVNRDAHKPVEIYAGHAPRFVTITGHALQEQPLRDLTGLLEQWIDMANGEVVQADIEPRPPVIDAKLPFPLNHQRLDEIPAGCDRSQELMRITTKLMYRRLDRQLVYSFLWNSQWQRVALDHRNQSEDRAMDYLWTTVLKADAWAKKYSPQGEMVRFADVRDRPWAELFDELTLHPPRYNPDHWPTLLREYAEEIATNTGADPLAPLFAGLWSVSVVVDHRSAVEVRRNWQEKMIVWACLIGNPSTMKTPATKPFTDILGHIEDDYNVAHTAQMAAYEQAMARFERQERDAQPNEVGAAAVTQPVRPVALRLVINDGTGQGMRNLLTERPRGCAVFYDEMSDFLMKQTTPGRDNPDRGFWVQGFNGGRHSTSLANAGFLQVSNIAIPMLGSVQPNVLRPMGKNLKSDGMIQRFIPVCLHPTDLPEPEDEIPAYLSKETEWESLLRYYLMQQPFTLEFSPEALAAMRQYEKWIHTFIGGLTKLHWNDGHVTSLGKSQGIVARLAGLFHLIERRPTKYICLEDYQRAERLMREYIIPAQSYLYNQLFGLGEESFHLWLMDTVFTHQANGKISLRDIKRIGKRRPELQEGSDRQKTETVIIAMDYLENFNVVTPDLTPGHNPRSHVWFVNEQLSEEMANRVQKRKDLHRWVMDEIAKINKQRKQHD